MKRTVWAYRHPSGEIFDVWYTNHPGELVTRHNGGVVLGPFKANIPPPPVDMARMFNNLAWIPDENGHYTILVSLL